MSLSSSPITLKEDLQIRHQKMQQFMRNADLDAILLSSNANLFYSLGKIHDGYFYLPQEGEPIFFSRSACVSTVKNCLIRKPEQIPEKLFEFQIALPKRVSLEEDELSASHYMRLCKVFSSAQVITKTPIAHIARMVKTAYELDQMQTCASKHVERYQHFPALYQSGMTDQDFSIDIEHDLRKHGHLGIIRCFGERMESFMGTLLAGDNASFPSPYDFSLGGSGMHPSFPLGANGHIILSGQSMMLDISGNYNGYIIDMSRCYSIGQLPQKAYDLHEIALEIQNELVQKGCAGATCSELFALALLIVKKYDVSTYFMGCEKQAKFVGHGLGIQLNEMPVICATDHQPLQENMALALEPKFCLPGVGAVGIENTFVVRKNGLEKLSTGCEEQIIDLTK